MRGRGKERFSPGGIDSMPLGYAQLQGRDLCGWCYGAGQTEQAQEVFWDQNSKGVGVVV
jgi:hypothetical protein